jgi:hypothetical protein
MEHVGGRPPVPLDVAPRNNPAPVPRLCDSGRMDGIVRIGDTVRRPGQTNTELVARVLRLLETEGVPWAPRFVGMDDEGREILSWISGSTGTSGDEMDLVVLANIVRRLHDLTTGLVEGFECVIHDDLQPRNVVVHGRVPVGLIDWEQARPGRRVEDVAKLCWSFIEPTPGRNPIEIGRDWRSLVQAYGLDPSGDLLSTAIAQIDACAKDIERESARGSLRHQALATRGDHLVLRAMHSWASENETTLLRELTNW